MPELKGTKTEKNLWEAFAGESQARNKYDFYASVAKKEGYEQIAGIFQQTADNEKEHAKLWLKALSRIGGTMDNLQSAAESENYEWSSMYRQMAQDAQEEGFPELADQFSLIASVEESHEKRYRALIHNLETHQVFVRPDGQTVWKCRNCGYEYVGSQAPTVCPACKHPQAFFELNCENY